VPAGGRLRRQPGVGPAPAPLHPRRCCDVSATLAPTDTTPASAGSARRRPAPVRTSGAGGSDGVAITCPVPMGVGPDDQFGVGSRHVPGVRSPPPSAPGL